MVTVICPTLLKTLDLNVFLQESAKITEDLLKLLFLSGIFLLKSQGLASFVSFNLIKMVEILN